MIIKKIILSVFLLVVLNCFLFSENSSIFGFSYETGVGLKTGSVEELVFEDEIQISKLLWKQQCVPQFNIECNIKFYSIFIRAKYSTVIPIKSGFLEDFDYLTQTENVISHYSMHDLYTDKDYSFSGQIGYNINIVRKKYQLLPFIGITYQNRKFTAQDGYLQYPVISGSNWTGDEVKTFLTGTVITYEQSIWYPYFGIENKISFGNCSVGLSISYYPYISVDSLDSHILRLAQFYDSMKGSWGGKVDCYCGVIQ